MRSSKPPACATWLLEHAGVDEALVGDLVEASRGRSGAWYWRQVLVAIVVSVPGQIRAHKLQTARVLIVGVMLGFFGYTAVGGATVDLTTGVQVNALSTGWFDAGIVGGSNKLVPMISFQLKNVSHEKLVALQVNALFHRVGDRHEWGNGFRMLTGSEGLTPDVATGTVTIRSPIGYRGTGSRAEILGSSQFVDATIELFAKYGAEPWTRLGEYPITRQLIER